MFNTGLSASIIWWF